MRGPKLPTRRITRFAALPQLLDTGEPLLQTLELVREPLVVNAPAVQDLVYPGHPHSKYKNSTDYLIDHLLP
jgi:hypothetical protein